MKKTKTPQRRHRLISILLIICILTLCTASYVLGRISDKSGYYGQLIDTIVINSQSQSEETIGSPQPTAASPKPSSAQADSFTVAGTVQYSDGSPYPNGLVEMHSEPRYTITDADGNFSFENVEVSQHTFSVFKDGQVVATCAVDFTRSDNEANPKDAYAKISAGNYTVNLPMKAVQLELSLSVDNDVLDITGSNAIEASQPPAQNSNSPSPTSKPETSNAPPTPSPSPTATHTNTPQPSEAPKPSQPKPSAPQPSASPPSPSVSPSPSESPEANTPDVDVNDDYNPSTKWTQLSHVDIFSPRTGNSGVFKDLAGKNVIKPGSSGRYVFKLQNSNSYAITYSLLLQESDSNNPKLPMKYRLLNGTTGSDYVGGDSSWKNADVIKKDSTTLEAGKSGTFTLEWEWETKSDEADTAIGIQGGSPVYVINIIIKAMNK